MRWSRSNEKAAKIIAKAENLNAVHYLFTISNLPIRYLVIPKSGCTFVKNVLWRLEQGTIYENQIRIHKEDRNFLRAMALGLTDKDVAQEDFAFTVIRHPVDRFFSLYSDKVIGERHRSFVRLRDTLLAHYDLDPDASTIEAHRANLYALASFIEENLADERHLPRDGHWTPQLGRKKRMHAANLKILLLNDLSSQLELLLSPIVPDIGEVIASLEKNRSGRALGQKKEILDPALRRRILDIYGLDATFFSATKGRWNEIMRRDDPWAHIPRYRQIDRWLKSR
ncbi:sulfotransferase family 2 domain-containing protein [Aestuariibius insulae]|uniref:sulfotransferase family 2 domain-containing protein n=1 Tax=Aestuariibius insulae TaxID=2058287 RepID=UPI00345EE666